MQLNIITISLTLICCFHASTTWATEPILPIPEPQNLSPQHVALGQTLFHDTQLSIDNSISCASCHQLDAGGVDGLARSFGIEGREGDINTPTVFNSALNFRQFWNGRAATLEEQINGPLTNPNEMGNNWQNVIQTLQQDPNYPALFNRLYDDGITADNIRHAIAEFERSLNLTNSRFDAYLKGDQDAISVNEKKGYQLFKGYGCIACHQGAAVGGNMYQHFGIMEDYFKERGSPVTHADLGRFTVTGNPDDQHVFKVPSLRLAAHTAPYFHDGSAKTLAQAIHKMAKYQLGRTISDTDVAYIKSFIQSLAGSYTGDKP